MQQSVLVLSLPQRPQDLAHGAPASDNRKRGAGLSVPNTWADAARINEVAALGCESFWGPDRADQERTAGGPVTAGL